MIDNDEIRSLIKQTVRETVYEVLTGLGFDPGDPHAMQANLHYLDKIRRGSEIISQKIKITIITTLIPTLLFLLWQAIRKIVRE